MKRYAIEELSKADVYQADEKLATLARRVAAAYYQTHRDMLPPDLSLGDFKRAMLRGEYPDLVKAAVDAAARAGSEKARSAQSGVEAIADLAIPGYVISVEDQRIIISGPFSEDLHVRLKRLGGYWDGANGTNRKAWIVPAEKGASLKRVFANARQQAAAQQKAAARAEAVRWVGFVESAAEKGYLYDKGVSKLQGMGFEQWPDLAERLAVAKQRVADAKAAQAQARETARPAARPDRILFPVSRMPVMGKPVRWRDRVLVFTGTGEKFRIHEDHPAVHGSHLLGHEGELGAYAYYRTATADEIAALEAQEAETAAGQARQQELAQLARFIQDTGERPLQATPAGDVVHDTFTVHGSGSRFVIGADWIWYIQNHGMDGDDWSGNNVSTGGAGAIGWRVPFTADLAARIRGA